MTEKRKSFIKKWGGLIILSLALAIIIIDTTLLNVSLRNIITDLNTDIQSLQWVITIYALTLAAFTITGGRLGDLFGRKKMFMLGAVLFALGSFIASVSHSVGILLIGESIIEGIGAALMMPATASLLLASFRGRDRAIAFAIWGSVAGAASAVGPILGGWLTSAYSWRWGFRINVFVVIVLLIGSALLIRESRDKAEKTELDWLGVFLSSTGLLALVFGIIESTSYGWWWAKQAFELVGHKIGLAGFSVTPVAIGVGLILLTLFALWEHSVERRGHTPLVSLGLFKNRQFTSGSVTISVMTLGMTGIIFALPVYMQAVQGKDAFHTGLSLLPLSIALFVASPASLGLAQKLTPKSIIQIGLTLTAVSFWVIRIGIVPSGESVLLSVGLITFGIGMGMVQSQINNLTLSAVSVQQGGEASGVNSTLRQVGSSFGSSIIGAVLLASLATNIVNNINNSTVLLANAKPKIVAAVKSQGSNIEFGQSATKIEGSDKLPPAVAKTIADEMKYVSNQATVDAVQAALAIGGIFAILSIVVSSWLPNIKKLETAKSTSTGH